VFHVGPREKKLRRVRSEEGLRRTHALAKLSSRSLAVFLDQKSLPASQKKILKEARERFLEAEVRRGGIKRRGSELAQIRADILRLREHARALKGTHSNSTDAIVKRLLAAEDQAKKVARRVAELKSEVKQKTRAAERALAKLGAH
jgi:TRAP-type mannitol/chloroaromatic compound transport system substrate-binding protein